MPEYFIVSDGPMAVVGDLVCRDRQLSLLVLAAAAPFFMLALSLCVCGSRAAHPHHPLHARHAMARGACTFLLAWCLSGFHRTSAAYYYHELLDYFAPTYLSNNKYLINAFN